MSYEDGKRSSENHLLSTWRPSQDSCKMGDPLTAVRQTAVTTTTDSSRCLAVKTTATCHKEMMEEAEADMVRIRSTYAHLVE